MTIDPLKPSLNGQQKRKLKAMAQRMDPQLKLGKAGLSDTFVASINEALERLELVKVRFDEFKAEKHELMPIMAERTQSELVMQVGHVAVLFRRNPDPAKQRISL